MSSFIEDRPLVLRVPLHILHHIDRDRLNHGPRVVVVVHTNIYKAFRSRWRIAIAGQGSWIVDHGLRSYFHLKPACAAIHSFLTWLSQISLPCEPPSLAYRWLRSPNPALQPWYMNAIVGCGLRTMDRNYTLGSHIYPYSSITITHRFEADHPIP